MSQSLPEFIDGNKVIPGRPHCAGLDVTRDFGSGIVCDETSPNVVRAAVNAHSVAREAWRELAMETIKIVEKADDWPSKRRQRAEELGEVARQRVEEASENAIKSANVRLREIHGKLVTWVAN
jgi:transcription elongation factor GreA-like protein